MLNNKDTYTVNGKNKVVINNTTKEEIKFRFIISYSLDGSTEIKLNNDNYILIKADKTLFSYNGRIEFRNIHRNFDKSTLIKLNNGDWITIKKDQK